MCMEKGLAQCCAEDKWQGQEQNQVSRVPCYYGKMPPESRALSPQSNFTQNTRVALKVQPLGQRASPGPQQPVGHPSAGQMVHLWQGHGEPAAPLTSPRGWWRWTKWDSSLRISSGAGGGWAGQGPWGGTWVGEEGHGAKSEYACNTDIFSIWFCVRMCRDE